MGNQKWISEEGILYPVNGGIIIENSPGPGVWQVTQSGNPMDKRLGLVKIDNKFTFDYKIYDLGGTEMFDKVRKVWNSSQYIENGRNLGVIYNGLKGTGKTVSAKLLCNSLDLPTIIINHSYEGGILDFVQSLEFECILFIDEAEKTFTGDDQQILLKMIDGVYNKSRKLYILTTNTLTINENLISRPGRIRYIQEFGNLSPEAVNMYVDDNLLDKSKKDQILEIADLLEISTIDILKSIVEEVNILGFIDSKTNLNIPISNYVFDILLMSESEETDIPKVLEVIKECPKSVNLLDWLGDFCDTTKYPDYESEENFRRIGDKVSGGSAYISRLTTRYDTFFLGQQTSVGEVLKGPKDLPDPRFLVVNAGYDGRRHLCMILKQRATPSLYGGKLIQKVL